MGFLAHLTTVQRRGQLKFQSQVAEEEPVSSCARGELWTNGETCTKGHRHVSIRCFGKKRITQVLCSESNLGRARDCREGSVQSTLSMRGYERGMMRGMSSPRRESPLMDMPA